jgi:hypothetical protein
MFIAPYRFTATGPTLLLDPAGTTGSESTIIVGPTRQRDLHGFDQEWKKGKYSLCWESWSDFDAWRCQEQQSKSIEFVRKNVRSAGPGIGWKQRHEYVCGRQGAGGEDNYVPKCDRKRNLEPKRIKCPCRLLVKTYPDTTKILGKYIQEHSHPIGRENVKFTRLSLGTKARIIEMLQMGVDSHRIVSKSPEFPPLKRE